MTVTEAAETREYQKSRNHDGHLAIERAAGWKNPTHWRTQPAGAEAVADMTRWWRFSGVLSGCS